MDLLVFPADVSAAPCLFLTCTHHIPLKPSPLQYITLLR